MADRDPWQIYHELTNEQKDAVYQKVRARRMAPMAKSMREDPDEFQVVCELFDTLEQERSQRKHGDLLKTFLPT
jgi:hypothetical protein